MDNEYLEARLYGVGGAQFLRVLNDNNDDNQVNDNNDAEMNNGVEQGGNVGEDGEERRERLSYLFVSIIFIIKLLL